MARVTREPAAFHVRLEFSGERHDCHVFVPAIHIKDDAALVAWVNEKLTGAALVP